MTQEEIINAIDILTKVVQANSYSINGDGNVFGSKDVIDAANAKINELIPLINTKE